MVLQVTLGAEDERLLCDSRGEPLQVLAGQAVQPGEPVRAGDLDDAPVGPVHEGKLLAHDALLPHRVAVMRGDAFVRGLRLDGAGQVKHWRFHSSVLLLQSWQRPNTVRCETLTSNPCRSSSAWVSGVIVSRPASSIFPQSWQTKCT